MAVDFKTPHTRTSEYLMLPEDIVVKPELNGRHELPDVEWLIESFQQVGQLQPVAVSAEDGKAVLRMGFSRWRAAIEINKRNLLPVPFKLRCVYLRADDLKGFIAGIHENAVRNPAQPIDDAYNIAKLETWNMTHEEIAKIYRQDVKWVAQRLALLDLVPEAQQAVIDGRMKLPAAAHFSKLNKQVQRARLKDKAEGEKITGKDARPEPAPDAQLAATPKVPRMSLADIKAVLQCIIDTGKWPDARFTTAEERKPSDSVQRFIGVLLDEINGAKGSGGD